VREKKVSGVRFQVSGGSRWEGAERFGCHGGSGPTRLATKKAEAFQGSGFADT